uniref:Uncharacterized protein n=1 Tax=Dulem virus 31 TaxID=3145749 RepID=A0AAU8AVA0_9VIRU
MTEKINNISQIIRSTEEYSDVCDMCRDEILLYPTISGRTNYTQKEVEEITLKRIIDKLQAKEQECERLKQWKEDAENLFKTQTDNADKIINRYKQALDEIEKTINEDDFNLCPIDDSCDCHRGLEKYILDIINQVKESE